MMQPNKLFALYSDDKENFTDFDMTLESALFLAKSSESREDAEEMIRQAVDNPFRWAAAITQRRINFVDSDKKPTMPIE